jgi:hypothetical protein
MADKKDEAAIEGEVIEMIQLEKTLQAEELELMQDPRFGAFLKRQKEFKEKSEVLWETIKNEMEANNIKNIKGTWGSITLAERVTFKIDAKVLAPKFLKKVPDTKKIGEVFYTEGKAPAGAEPQHTKYLMRRIK